MSLPPVRGIVLSVSLALLLGGLSGCLFDSGERAENLWRIARWEDQRLAPRDSLSSMIRHQDAHVRLAAVRSAGLIGRPDVLTELSEALTDRSGAVARQAAFSLGLLGDRRAAEPLGRATQAVDPALRLAALRGLAHLDHDGQALLTLAASGLATEAAAAWDGLRNVAAGVDSTQLHDALLDGLQRAQADVLWRVLRCAEVVATPALAAVVEPFALAPQPQVRIHALRALGRIGGEAALGTVTHSLLADNAFRGRPRQRVDIAALRAFGALTTVELQAQTSPADLDKIVSRLVAAAGDPHPHVAETALTTMQQMVAAWDLPAEAALQESLLPVWRIHLARSAHSHLDSEHLGVRRAAIGAWTHLRGSGCASDLVAFMKREQSPLVLESALTALAAVHPDPLLLLSQYAANDQPAFFGDTPRPVLQNPLVRAAALRGLAHVAGQRPQVFPDGVFSDFVLDRLTTGAADPDFVVAATAAELLGDFPTRQSLIALAELWDTAEGPDMIDLQRSVLGALNAMGAKVATLRKPDHPAEQPDHLLEIFKLILQESFDAEELRIRYEGRQAALATELLAADLVPTEASLLATRPAVRRSARQAPLTLPFKAPQVICTTARGQFTLGLDTDLAPNTCAVFLDLIEGGFFDNMIFHRVVPDFVVQGGDPLGTGWGGPGFTLRSEWSSTSYERGRVGIAHSGKDSGGSQFFVTLSPQPHLNGRYTIFGAVTEGLEIVDLMEVGDTFSLAVAP